MIVVKSLFRHHGYPVVAQGHKAIWQLEDDSPLYTATTCVNIIFRPTCIFHGVALALSIQKKFARVDTHTHAVRALLLATS
jgi:hypothetical protein